MTITSGRGEATGGSVDVTAGNGNAAGSTGGSINMRVGDGQTTDGSVVLKDASGSALMTVSSTTFTSSTAAVSITASSSTVAITAQTTVTITGSSTNIAGGLLHVNSNSFKITSDGTTQKFLVTSAGAVTIADDITLQKAAASITHSGATSLTISSASLVLSGATTVSGGILHVHSQNLKVTSDGSTQKFLVTASSGAVAMAGDLTMSAAAATINHTGGTSLTVASTKLIVSGGDVIFAGSASSPGSGTNCVQGQFAYDTSYIYICGTTNAWYKAALSTHH